MSERFEISERAVQTIGGSAERLIGYFYAGLFPIVILSIERPAVVKSFVEATGGLFATVICMALGIGIFTLYFRILGELLIFPVLHFVHLLHERLSTRIRGETAVITTIGKLVEYGVSPIHGRAAYTLVRDHFFSQKEKILLEIEHGELHVLYLTAVLSLAAYFTIWAYFGVHPSNLYLGIALVSYVAGLLADIRQHSKECVYFGLRESDLRLFLTKSGFTGKEKLLVQNEVPDKGML